MPTGINKKFYLNFIRVNLLLYFLVIFLTPVNADSQKIKVAYIPMLPDYSFWANKRMFLDEIANDLGVEMIYLDYRADFPRLNALKKLAASENKPDYLIYHYFDNIGKDILSITKKAGIKAFTVTTEVPQMYEREIGKPRTKFPNWIGHMSPDDEEAGYQLANLLLEEGKSRFNRNEPYKRKLISISGIGNSTLIRQRTGGLTRRVKETKHIDHIRSINTGWEAENSEYAVYQLFQRNPDISLIWNATSELTEGSINAVKKFGLIPGQDVLIGGFDWTPELQASVKEGSLQVALGGHYMDAGWSLVLIYDYHHNMDFKNELGTMIKSKLKPLTKDNIDKYVSVFNSERWKSYDFSQYSKVKNTSLERYDFSIEKIYQYFE